MKLRRFLGFLVIFKLVVARGLLLATRIAFVKWSRLTSTNQNAHKHLIHLARMFRCKLVCLAYRCWAAQVTSRRILLAAHVDGSRRLLWTYESQSRRLLVDAFRRWRILDKAQVKHYAQSFRTLALLRRASLHLGHSKVTQRF